MIEPVIRLGLLLTMLLFVPPAAGAAAGKHVAGWVEKVRIEPDGFVVKAKLDTGARTSAIDARHIRTYRRDGERRARFDVTDAQTVIHHFDQPVVRMAHVKLRGGGVSQRPVVRLGICLDGERIEAQVDLTNRNGFDYPMLVGRRLLRQGFIVDPSRTFLTQPQCREGSAPRS